MGTPSNDDPFRHDLELEVDAELELAESSAPPDGELGSPADWQFDPTDVDREEAGLRNLRGALDALDHQDPPTQP